MQRELRVIFWTNWVEKMRNTRFEFTAENCAICWSFNKLQ